MRSYLHGDLFQRHTQTCILLSEIKLNTVSQEEVLLGKMMIKVKLSLFYFLKKRILIILSELAFHFSPGEPSVTAQLTPFGKWTSE